MNSSQQDYSLFSHSIPKKASNLTLFDDLLHNPDTENSHRMSNLEDQYARDSSPSDCESGISGTETQQKAIFSENGLTKINEEDRICEIIKSKFVSSLSSYGFTAQVETLLRNNCSDIMSRVKYQSFHMYSKGMEIKRDGNANVKYAWYGASKDEIYRIISHGFSLPPSTGVYGHGVYLTPVDHPVESMQASAPDENGLRHMLLCRVILGNTEVIRPGSGQYKPSSEEFDSGIDDSLSPKKYIIWNGNMNTHVFPEFVVRFRASSYCRGCQKNSPPSRIPNSDWLPFAALINDLCKFLPSDAIKLIFKNHNDFKKHKITRQEMIQRVRRVAGDEMLIAIIKSYRSKQAGSASQNSSHGLKRRN